MGSGTAFNVPQNGIRDDLQNATTLKVTEGEDIERQPKRGQWRELAGKWKKINGVEWIRARAYEVRLRRVLLFLNHKVF